VFNEHFRKGKNKICCKRLLKDESYVDEMNGARKEYIRKHTNDACSSIEKEMVVRYMTVLTQIFVTMKDILSFYFFLVKMVQGFKTGCQKRHHGYLVSVH
jgi:hypothetical protein